MKLISLLILSTILHAQELPGAIIKHANEEKAKVTEEIEAKKHKAVVDILMTMDLSLIEVTPLAKEPIREEKKQNEEQVELNRRLKMLAGEVKHWKNPISKVDMSKVSIHESVLNEDFDRLYAKYKH